MLRWSCITPDRSIAVLLLVELLLFFWDFAYKLGLNHHTGYPVLASCASVAVFAVSMAAWFMLAATRGWRFQYRLRSLMLLVVAVAFPVSWLATEVRLARKRAETRCALEAMGGNCYYRETDLAAQVLNVRPSRSWAKRVLGEDFFEDVQIVILANADAADDCLVNLPSLRFVRDLDLRGTRLTDADLNHVKRLTALEALDLSSTGVTDAGLGKLASLKRLRVLCLRNTRITDAGMWHARQFADLWQLQLCDDTLITDAGLDNVGKLRLRVLRLDGTGVTDAGLELLGKVPTIEELGLSKTRVDGSGFSFLVRLACLRTLDLSSTKVSDTTVANLTAFAGLRELALENTVVTDIGIEHLGKLRNLKVLYLRNARVTNTGIEKLHKALPRCMIYFN